jgi:hypothetical protein
MNKVKIALISIIALLGVAFVAPNVAYASTASDAIQGGVTAVGGQAAGNNVPLETRAKDITNVFLFILGAIAVIMIIIGGIRYVVSAGEGSAVKGAKNTILYAVVGLVVAILAYAIVNFVITSLK